MNDYLLKQLIQLSNQNITYRKIYNNFQTQANQQLNNNQYIIKLTYNLTHGEVTSQTQMKPNEYINEVETAIMLWCKIHGLQPKFKRNGSSIDLINKDGEITYTVEYNLINI